MGMRAVDGGDGGHQDGSQSGCVLPVTVASCKGLPRRRSTLAKSTSNTPFDTTMPTIMMMPMKLFTLSLVPVR